MKRRTKGLVSCILWAGIAAALAIQINGYFWWVGILVGALLGYLFCEPKEFFCAFPRAWREVTGWRLEMGWWKVLGVGILAFIGAGMTVAILLAPAIIWPNEKGLIAGSITLSATIGSFGGFAVFIFGIWSLVEFIGAEEHFFDYKEDIKFVKGALTFLNPVSVFFYLVPLGVVRLAKIIVPEIPGGVVVLGRFIGRVYILIHSEFRSLCAVDIAFGGTVGYCAGSMTIGMIFGGVFWIVNYKIVTQKILRLNFDTQ